MRIEFLEVFKLASLFEKRVIHLPESSLRRPVLLPIIVVLQVHRVLRQGLEMVLHDIELLTWQDNSVAHEINEKF